jgi:hypothetical protein
VLDGAYACAASGLATDVIRVCKRRKLKLTRKFLATSDLP